MRVIAGIMSSRMLAGLVLAMTCRADPAVINGVVLENQTGYALARARVKLARLVSGKMVPVRTIETGRTGQFTFPSVEPGIYTISGTRVGFAETFHGQRRDNAPPMPFTVQADKNVFIELRLKRFAAITGKLMDENRAGLPGVTVHAYDANAPSRSLGSGLSDDRGIYRISGLLPGRYFVRTAAAILEDKQQLMPAYHPFTAVDIREAQPVRADFDNDSRDIDIQPLPGRLHGVFGEVTGCLAGTEVRVTLSHETGRWDVRTGCAVSFGFVGVAPGSYELIATGVTASGPRFWFGEIDVNSDRNLGSLGLTRGPEVRIQAPAGTKAVARRRDRAGPGPAEDVPPRWSPLPGYWEMTAVPPEGQYIESIGTSYSRGGARNADPDWFQLSFESYFGQGDVRITLAPGATVAGRAVLGGAPAVVAPVYLLPISLRTRAQVNGLRKTITSENGAFEFTGLAPGNYLLLSSWDLTEMTETVFRAARAEEIKVEGKGGVAKDIEVYQAP